MIRPDLSTVMLRWIRRALLVTDEPSAWKALRATLQAQEVALFDPGSSPPLPDPVDCVIADVAALADDRLREGLRALDADGAVYIVFPEPGRALPEVAAMLACAELRIYVAWAQRADGGLAGVPVDSADRVVAVMAVRTSYAPLDHARRLLLAGKAHWCFELLYNVPASWLETPEALGQAALLKLLCFVAWDAAAGAGPPRDRLNRFCRAQREFYTASNYLECSPEACFAQARLWKTLGLAHMGARLLRTLAHVSGNADAAREAQTLAAGSAVATEEKMCAEDTASIEVIKRLPRILMICHGQSDYGHDTLFYGLTRLLGAEQATDFPWKPWLHGVPMEKAYSYPCTFDLPGRPRDLEWVRARLREGAFDVVTYTDTLCQLDRGMVRAVMDAATGVPLLVLDTWDEAGDYLPDILGHVGRSTAQAYFKREMLVGAPYPPDTFPLPFSYPDDRVPETVQTDRDIALFWAGKRQDGHRRLLLGHLERVAGVSLDATYPPEEYARALDRSRVGLCLFGLGFDTVRYWELPAHGCLLLAERPPIQIPYNFRDGTSAVFFDDAAELEEKLQYYLAHPEEAASIAHAGREHFVRHHTSTERARQFLAHVEAVLKAAD